jgi:hypothetical protein
VRQFRDYELYRTPFPMIAGLGGQEGAKAKHEEERAEEGRRKLIHLISIK